MKSAEAWLAEYSRSHTHRVNCALHMACIPLIVFSIVCALRALPWGDAWLNPATLLIALASFYYLLLAWRLAAGLLAVFALMALLAQYLRGWLGGDLALAAGTMFIVGWIGQFAGHLVEGARPSFFKDLQFLLIGPLWEVARIYRMAGMTMTAQGDQD